MTKKQFWEGKEIVPFCFQTFMTILEKMGKGSGFCAEMIYRKTVFALISDFRRQADFQLNSSNPDLEILRTLSFN